MSPSPDLLIELGLFRRIQVVAVTVLADVHNNIGRHRGELVSDCLQRLGDGQNQMRLRRVRDRVHTNTRLQRCRRSASHAKRVGSSLRRTFGRRSSPTPSFGAGGWGVLAACPRAWDCAAFRGRGFVPRTTPS